MNKQIHQQQPTEKHLDHKSNNDILCGDPDGYGSGCGRKEVTRFSGCTFCTKGQGMCNTQQYVTVTMSVVTLLPTATVKTDELVKLTSLEILGLRCLMSDNYMEVTEGMDRGWDNGGVAWRNGTWTAIWAAQWSRSSLPGVVASLQRKGLVCCSGKGKEATIEFTALGIKVAKEGNLQTIAD